MAENRKPSVKVKCIKIKNGDTPESIVERIKKSEDAIAIDVNTRIAAGDWIEHTIDDLIGLRTLVEESSILPQCIRAYKQNIAGFGISVKYKDYIETKDETAKMKAEWDRLQNLIDSLSPDKPLKELFEDVIEMRETYGIAYVEVIRDLAGNVVELSLVNDVPSITKTLKLNPYIEVKYKLNGEEKTRRKQFRKYRQDSEGNTVYFKEFGDPRPMDNTTGEYLARGERVNRNRLANELIEFKIGTRPYGLVRWWGQILGIDGSRRAEILNDNYFINGRHTPLMLIINNGTLSDDSYQQLQSYIEEVRGEAGQHAFLLLETETKDNITALEGESKTSVEVKDIANILQQDGLFQNYLDNNRKRIQSAFLLPDIYTGYTQDFNRATSQSAVENTEKQVFKPERESFAWILNHKLLENYGFKYVEVDFNEPDITNPEDVATLLSIYEKAGGITPNVAHDEAMKILGAEGGEQYPDEWGNMPLVVAQQQKNSEQQQAFNDFMMSATGYKTDVSEEMLGVVKSARDLILKQQEKDDN